MNSPIQSLNILETELKSLSQNHLSEFYSKIQFKKGIDGLQYKLKLLSKITEKLSNDVINKSIDFIRRNKITDNVTLNSIVRLNHKYILRFNKSIAFPG